jgi:hypothetical protein
LVVPERSVGVGGKSLLKRLTPPVSLRGLRKRVAQTSFSSIRRRKERSQLVARNSSNLIVHHGSLFQNITETNFTTSPVFSSWDPSQMQSTMRRSQPRLENKRFFGLEKNRTQPSGTPPMRQMPLDDGASYTCRIFTMVMIMASEGKERL